MESAGALTLQRMYHNFLLARASNIAQGACVAPGSTMLVCELMEGGSVHDLLRSGQLTWAEG
jgi:hypothetical protein